MDCNKEEAIRAKELAERRMNNKDFIGARKIALKAQQLYPELENISQILTVCDVHVSAMTKVSGEIDWYGILQVESTSDDSSIRKQYLKLALLLHPDKNKFGGAEAAFKLIGEAQRTLSDRDKRALHDMKTGTRFRPVSMRPVQPQQTSFSRKQPGPAKSSTSTQFSGISQQQTSSDSSNQTFWTICPFCGVKFQYYKSIMNKSIRCQSCNKGFYAYDFDAKTFVPSAAAWRSAVDPQPENPCFNTAGMSSQANVGKGSTASVPSTGARNSTEFVAGFSKNTKESDGKFEKVNLREIKREQTAKPSGEHGNGSRHNSYKRSQDGGDFVSPTSKKLKQAIPNDRREINNGGLANGIKIQCDAGKRESGLHTEGSSKGNHAGFESDSTSVPDTSTYSDPEFCDFGKEREKRKFAVDQIWAAYDEIDAMPRYYAWIRQVNKLKFKLKFTWLEYNPVTKDQSIWHKVDLPVGCGSYKTGQSEVTEECLMFSHLMPLKRGTKKNSFDIYPQKNEVWALFKGWSIQWALQVDDKRQYEYDVFEVISDFTEGSEIIAVRLVKIQGFNGLFVQSRDKVKDILKLRECDILRFSHRIPSYKLKGNEREGIPKDSLELDCASLPTNFADSYPSLSLESLKVTVVELDSMDSTSQGDKTEPSTGIPEGTSAFEHNQKIAQENTQSSSSHSKENGKCTSKPNISTAAFPAAYKSGENGERDKLATKQKDGPEENSRRADDSNSEHEKIPSRPPSANCNAYEFPDSEFHEFEEGRTADKFEEGQIWALYSDVDSYPKYYALVKKVELDSGFKVHVRWLEGYSDREEDKQWFEKQLPVGFGSFRLLEESAEFDTTDTFSHLVNAKQLTGRGSQRFVISPEVGEIWALYKDWSPTWSLPDVKDCGYDAVEILASDQSGIKVSVLKKVNGYGVVFKHRKGSGSELHIPIAERLRFSHRIPAFKLTEEKGGKLRGYLELDPASVPEILLCV